MNYQINAKNLIRSGIGAAIYMTDVKTKWDNLLLNNYKGNSSLIKTFTRWRYRFNNVFSMTPGIYAQFYTLNNDFSIEPRIGFRWEASPKTTFSLGSGLHSQLQPRQVYFYEVDGILINKSIEMSKSWQTVLAYNQKLGMGMHLKNFSTRTIISY